MSEPASESQRWLIEAEVMPRLGVNDPQGEAVLSGLRSLEFAGTRRVRIGKLIRVEVSATSEDDAVDQGTRMCEKLLANPVIEEYVVSAARIG
jgi:phosphoribosylformylglycinamidine synthase PurS subunit